LFLPPGADEERPTSAANIMSAAASLTAALAGRYTIEREIGRGGMATPPWRT